jgi:ABC-type sugar transport system ATPase subunit
VTTPHIEIAGVSKRFGGVHALRDVSLAVERAQVHALVGENGAGKSTLGKVIAGLISPDAGELRIDGAPVVHGSAHSAIAHGITMIAQEIAVVPARTVIENVFLGTESKRGIGVVRRTEMRRRYTEVTARAGFELDPDARVGHLRLADRQKVEILRALARDTQLLIMDEPTAALSGADSERLFEVIARLRSAGTTVIYVSHFLKETLRLADTVTVLKDGQVVRTAPAPAESPESLVLAMLGTPRDLAFPDRRPPGADAPVALSVRGLQRGRAVRDVSFDVRAGEIVGLAGLIGSGRSEAARLVFGADRPDAGEIEIEGRPVTFRSPRQAIARGIAMLPESRKDQGLVMARPVAENVVLAHLGQVSSRSVLSRGAERKRVARSLEEVGVAGGRAAAPVDKLSGGNQQKTLFAKWLFRRPRILIADEPTRGVDVGAKKAIYDLIAGLAADGIAVLLISSEHEELLGLAHRILVMHEGRVTGELDGATATEEQILRLAMATPVAA